MSSENNKMMRIMNELTGFYLKKGNQELNIELSMTDKQGQILMSGYTRPIDQKWLDDLNDMINEPRKDEAEEYYWNLMGPSEFSELNLLALMVDEGEIKYQDNSLTVRVVRKF